MTKPVHLQYKKKPLLFFLRAPFYAFWGRSKVFHGKESIPPITVKMDGLKVNKVHLSRFNKICNIKDRHEISLIYPITLVFPFFQRILSLKQAPLSLFNVLGKRLKINRYRQIDLDETLDIFCEISCIRIVSKGLEVDLSAIINVAGEIVWTATETFFYRGDFGKPDANVANAVFESIPDAKILARWFLSGGNGFRFARISGDGNGIHYSRLYARFFGFKRDFAQPFLILGNTINRLENNGNTNATFLDVAFKGQFYYEKDVTIKGMKMNGRSRFDIYSEGNDRPCMKGLLYNQDFNIVMSMR